MAILKDRGMEGKGEEGRDDMRVVGITGGPLWRQRLAGSHFGFRRTSVQPG